MSGGTRRLEKCHALAGCRSRFRSGVEVTVDGQLVKVLGPKGALEHRVAEPIKVTRGENGELQVTGPTTSG